MIIQEKTLLQFKDLTYSFDNKVLFQNISGSIVDKDKIGLIGINGSGKSTLLKILAGILKPESNINSTYRIEYVPQLDLNLYKKEQSLFEYLLSINDEWWNVLIKYEQLFESKLDESRLLKTLSGGELVKLFISIAFANNPDIILLDEPTNHLDMSSLKKLINILESTNTAFIVVSHNIYFLNCVINTIWELDSANLEVFGGNYSFYKEEKEKRIQSQLNKYESTKKEIFKVKKALVSATERTQKKQAKLKKAAKTNDRSLPKIVRNAIKLRVQSNYGADKTKKEETIVDLSQKLETLKINKRKQIYLDIQSPQRSGLMFSIENGKLELQNRNTLITDINLNIYHKDRIAILGDNGSGKTTLIKQFEYFKNDLIIGNFKYGEKYSTLYVDQKYDLVNSELNLIENLQANNSQLNYENIRKILANLGFVTEADLQKKAGVLSGGETARLAFAIATSSDIDLLILDEPTNNLDIETIQRIEQAIINFTGSLVVISHDIQFLNNINIEKVFEIKDKNFKETTLKTLF